jgi:ATP-dependent Zn protease
MANELAGLTPGLVGADIQHVCNVAALMARRRGADAVVMQDLSNAIDRYTLSTIYYLYHCTCSTCCLQRF